MVAERECKVDRLRMVTFYNIHIEDGMLKANVHNETNGNKENITASIDG